MSKAYKVRFEDTRNGEVKEFETNCLSIVSIDEKNANGDFPGKTFTAVNCTGEMQISLMRALNMQIDDLKEHILRGILFEKIAEENGEDA